MKFSCDLNKINFLFEIIEGHQLSEKYKFLLSTRQRKNLASGRMKYFTILVCATQNDIQLNFELQGIALSLDQVEQMEEIEDYLENNLIFSKIEEKIKHAQSKNKNPIWALK